eukprot:7893871-Ditylum_brightwellii.AAC.1
MDHPFNLLIPIEESFEQIDKTQMLMEKVKSVFTDNQLRNKAFDLIFVTGAGIKACRKWRRKPIPDKIWANFQHHLADAHKELLKLQKAAQQADYMANITNTNNMQEQTAEALSQ